MIKHKFIKLVCVTAVCILLASILYFIPFPNEVDLLMEGVVVITADGPQYGKYVEKLKMGINGCEHKYLFQEDQIELVIQTSSSNWQFAIPSEAIKSLDADLNVPYITIPTEIATSKGSRPGYLAIDLDKGYFIAGCPDAPHKFLVGSANAPLEPETILEHFADWRERYFPVDNS